jgi:hypothetical protein
MTQETVVLTDFGQPVDKYVVLLRDQGYGITRTDVSLILRKPYSPGDFERVKGMLDAQRLAARVRRSIAPEFDESDYEKSSLLVLSLPEQWIDGLNFTAICSTCGRSYVVPDYDRRVRVEWKEPIVMLNGQVPMVCASVRDAIGREGLSGALFHAFDQEGQYSYLATSRRLGKLLVRTDEVLGLRGTCEECGLPHWEVNFGPLRYARADWMGEDFIYSAFEEGPLYSSRAFEVLKSFDNSVSRVSPVYLE